MFTPQIILRRGKEESLHTILPLVKKYGGLLVALTLDDGGIPATVEGRVAIAKRILAVAKTYGIEKKDIVFGNTVLCVEKQYLLVDWDDGEDVYLVASTHSGTEYVDILQYFADYFEQQYAYGGKDR